MREKIIKLLLSAYESGAYSLAGIESEAHKKDLMEEYSMKLDKLGIPKDKKFVWKKARKKPVVVHFREVTEKEVINTREGQQTAFPEQDFIIRGVEGEEYPIKKDIFEKTYDKVN